MLTGNDNKFKHTLHFTRYDIWELNEAEEKFFENIKDFYSFETAVKGATESFAASYIGAVLSSIDEQISKDAWRKDKYNIQ